MTAPDREALRALLSAATPGPWRVEADWTLEIVSETTNDLVCKIPLLAFGSASERGEANAAIIAAAVNALGPLLQALDVAEARLRLATLEVDGLRAAVSPILAFFEGNVPILYLNEVASAIRSAADEPTK